MSEVRAVLFDLFDTLVDLHFSRLPATEVGGKKMPGTLVFQHEALTARGHDVDFERFRSTLRETDGELMASHLQQGIELPTTLRFRRLAERLGIEDAELPSILTATHMGKLQEVAETPSHHDDVLRALRSRYRIGLCSNFSHTETALAILGGARLIEHFDALAVSEAVGIRKPRPEIFEHALEQLGTTAAETVHVGDNLEADVGGASAVGMRTVWIDRRVRDKTLALEAYDGPAPTWIVSDLSEIERLL